MGLNNRVAASLDDAEVATDRPTRRSHSGENCCKADSRLVDAEPFGEVEVMKLRRGVISRPFGDAVFGSTGGS